jgi:hypothetical protein
MSQWAFCPICNKAMFCLSILLEVPDIQYDKQKEEIKIFSQMQYLFVLLTSVIENTKLSTKQVLKISKGNQ